MRPSALCIIISIVQCIQEVSRGKNYVPSQIILHLLQAKHKRTYFLLTVLCPLIDPKNPKISLDLKILEPKLTSFMNWTVLVHVYIIR
jgi:hypothetical protein